ncbi:type V toxin-antitoxin system endoribonuclease antitoxin GhoS [Escherichia albertii]|uniref:type V toxin-antitoxin system endoribonuclease antitoxin GhoS n=1 Tax=Escherichia albertii TaxID=208962 RepID=UPI000743E907|nr:type V toxin-antitoxin system endoribonuclease antitoxin GhoS [Escherichia albertii]WDB49602.1 type V toxin-antitoxin system endoribonuclease antitoxin GhoS [Escherichia albertii]
MSSGDLVRYVITVMLHEETLIDINELNNYLTRNGFLLTMTDDEGKIHELGTNTFGLVSPQSEEQIRELVSGLSQSATGKTPEITIATREAWNSDRK